jgi:hypothetical protein
LPNPIRLLRPRVFGVQKARLRAVCGFGKNTPRCDRPQDTKNIQTERSKRTFGKIGF